MQITKLAMKINDAYHVPLKLVNINAMYKNLYNWILCADVFIYVVLKAKVLYDIYCSMLCCRVSMTGSFDRSMVLLI